MLVIAETCGVVDRTFWSPQMMKVLQAFVLRLLRVRQFSFYNTTCIDLARSGVRNVVKSHW